MMETTATDRTFSPRNAPQLSVLVALGVLILLLQAWQAFRPVPPQHWEYAIDAPPDDQLARRLQALGAGGWEIVSARRATSRVEGESKAAYEMILRRPVGLEGSVGLPPLPSGPQ
jgi:hypothetical protein